MEKLVRFDWAIKNILRDKANFTILEGFLSALLNEDVRVVRLLESESNKEREADKLNRVDLLVENGKGELVLIEVQVESEADFFHRLAFASAKLLTEYMEQGKPYETLKKVIVVGIVYFNLGQGQDYLYYGSTSFVGVHEQDTLGLSEEHQAQFGLKEVKKIFPEYHVIRVGKFSDEVQNAIDEWIYMLKHSAVKPEFQAKYIQDASTKLRQLNLSPEERRAYDDFLQDLMYQASMERTRWMTGWVAGKAEGIAEGIATVIRTMLTQGVDPANIATFTGIPVARVQAIQAEMQAAAKNA